MSKKSAKNNVRSILKSILLPSLLAILVVTAVIQGLFIVYLFKQNQIQANTRLALLIQQAAGSLNHQVSKDPRSGEVFISEAKLTLPPVPSQLGQIEYSYV